MVFNFSFNDKSGFIAGLLIFFPKFFNDLYIKKDLFQEPTPAVVDYFVSAYVSCLVIIASF